MSKGHRHPGPDPVALRADVPPDAMPCALGRPATFRPIIVAAIAPAPPWLKAARSVLLAGSVRQPVPIRTAVDPVGAPSSRGQTAQTP